MRSATSSRWSSRHRLTTADLKRTLFAYPAGASDIDCMSYVRVEASDAQGQAACSVPRCDDVWAKTLRHNTSAHSMKTTRMACSRCAAHRCLRDQPQV